jgi:hypothetical protein
VSVTLPTNVSRPPLAKPETSSPAGAVGTQVPALVQNAALPQAPRFNEAQLAHFRDAFERAPQALSEWASKFSGAPSEPLDTSLEAPTLEATGELPDPHLGASAWEDPGGVVQQTKENNCAPAAVAELKKSEGQYTEGPASELMDSLENRFTDGSGTTPHQMSNMLAHEGFKVEAGKSQVDAQSLDNAVLNDKKVMVQLDANKLATGDAQQPGSAHWVTVDGKDAQGNYTVKDPSSGSKYSVSADELSSAVDASWQKNGGGGMLVVDNAQGTDEATLAQQNDDHIETLGNTPGGGSRGKATYGREV